MKMFFMMITMMVILKMKMQMKKDNGDIVAATADID